MLLNERVLPTHIEESIRSIAELHEKQTAEATRFQRSIARITESLGRPRFFLVISLGVVAWVAANFLFEKGGLKAFDPPPFSYLQVVVSLAALFITMLILSTQQRDDVIAGHRERLTLELAILNEQKSAKIIQLLENLRRDSPAIPDRVDHEAAAMSTPADTHAVLEAIKESTTGTPDVTPTQSLLL